MKVAEDKLHEIVVEVTFREVAMLKAKQQAIEEFKQSKKYKASQGYDAGYDDEYDKGVEEIFYNIWRKHREVN